MNLKSMTALCVLSVGSQAIAGIGNTNFWVTNSQGEVYYVNGNNLNASSVHQITSDGLINDIAYVSETSMLANMTGTIVSVDLMTGQEQVIFNADDHYPNASANFTAGLARTGPDGVYFSVHSVNSDGSLQSVAGSVNPQTFGYQQLTPFNAQIGVVIDHHQLSGTRMMSANSTNDRIYIHSLNTGVIEQVYDLNYDIVSFMENDGQIFTLSEQGVLYRFNADNGLSVEIGAISGITGSIIGGTIPAPSALATLGLAGMFCSRRRR